MEHIATKRKGKPAVQVFKRQRRMSELKGDSKSDQNRLISPKITSLKEDISVSGVDDSNLVEDKHEANKENINPEAKTAQLTADSSQVSKRRLIEYFQMVDQHQLLEEDGP